MSTNTHYVTFPGYEGPCCADCAAAVGWYREMEASEPEYGKPCQSCEEMERERAREQEEWEAENEALNRLAEEYPDRVLESHASRWLEVHAASRW